MAQAEGPTIVEERTAARMPARRRVTRAARHWLAAHRPLVGVGAAVLLVGLAAVGGFGRARHTGIAADDRAEMARAERVVDSLARRAWADEAAPTVRPASRPSLDDAGLVALGYVDRARLGVGSPFRLATFALRDTRLPAPLGRTVAWAVLARTARGAVYATEQATAALTANGRSDVRQQLALVDSVVEAAGAARTGELAVRIGFALAQAEGVVDGGTTSIAARLAAQARDRRLAREDVTRLLAASAADRDVDALALLVRWRGARRLDVERPLLGGALRADDAAASRGGIALAAALRETKRVAELRALEASQRDSVDTLGTLGTLGTSSLGASPSGAASSGAGGVAVVRDALLPPRAARRLADLPSVRGGPPQAPVAVAAAAYRRQLLRSAVPSSPAARRFAERARSEESLVAELALASEAPNGPPPEVEAVALSAAVAMRPFAQDSLAPAMWGAGAPAPTADALAARYGLRAVTFDAAVPNAWRPHYLAQLAGALEDLSAVLPWVEFDGLAVRVGESVKRDSALALHDPASRTLYLPTATSAGTLAHELAHDLDWQTARTRLSVRGTYSTDRAMREGRGALAASVRGLTAARPTSAGSGEDRRPAELFARGVDWFVVSALAGAGRMNGALSAVQDETLAGYAGVVPPEAGDGAADALVSVLADMTVVPAASRERFLAAYGAGGAPSALAIVRSVSGLTPWWGTERLLRAAGLVRPGGCMSASIAPGPAAGGADSWRSALLRAAAESRARGMLRSRARRWTPAPARWSWEARATLGGPWSPAVADSAVARTRDALLRAAAWDDATRHPFEDGRLGGIAVRAAGVCR